MHCSDSYLQKIKILSIEKSQIIYLVVDVCLIGF